MSRPDALQQCSARILRDIGETTELHLRVSAWGGRDQAIGYVVHDSATLPSRPVWEAVQLVEENGDAIALHPFPTKSRQTPGDGDHEDVVIAIAGAVQDLAHILLWQGGHDPTWPRCPAHPGRHPLRVMGRQLSYEMRDGEPVVLDDTGASWICPRGDFQASIGRL